MKIIDGRGVRITIPSAPLDHWAQGCSKCKHGLTAMPEFNTTQPLYIQRAAQAALGLIQFCECKAGQAYRQYLRNAYATERKTQDMEAIQERVAEESVTPTFHYEQATALQPAGGAAYLVGY